MSTAELYGNGSAVSAGGLVGSTRAMVVEARRDGFTGLRGATD